MIALYQPGTSVFHRMRAGVKIIGFAVLTVAVSILGTTLTGLAATAALTVCCYLIAGLGLLEVLRQALILRWMIVVMLFTQLLFLPPVMAITNTGRVVVVVVLAALLTLTTRVPAVLDSIEGGLEPLRRMGVNPTAVSLVLALAVTTIPVILGFARNVRDAQCARGVRVGPHTAVVPLLVLSLKHGDELAEALAARGIE